MPDATARPASSPTRLEAEGFGVVRHWKFVLAGAESREQAEELAAASHGEVEPGGELVWEVAPQEPVRRLPGGLGGSEPAQASLEPTFGMLAGRGRVRTSSDDRATLSVGAAARRTCCVHARDDRADTRTLGGRRPSPTPPSRRPRGRASPSCTSGEEPAKILAPGTARRRALDDALEEVGRGLKTPSPQWKVHYALMLGLERVLSEKPPHLADGTELRRHQIDALAGMLTELIAAAQRQEEANGTALLELVDAPAEEEDEEDEPGNADDDDGGGRGGRRRARPRRRPPLPLPPPDRVRQDDRRVRLRRGRADDGRPDPHPPAAARRPVPARADRPRLPASASRPRSSAARRSASRTRSRSRRTPGSRATSAS